jgi:transposase
MGITWGHNKDHRPDLKQLLYTLTVTEDGGVPIYFTTDSGNTTDDTTHLKTWELLRELVGHPDFLYVADCKLASRENLRAIEARGGRFITVLPRTRREDAEFRRRVIEGGKSLVWKVLEEVVDDDGNFEDRLSVLDEELRTFDGFRLFWYFSQRKAEQDAKTRARQLEKLRRELAELQQRLDSKKTRLRTRAKVEQELKKVLSASAVAPLLNVTIEERELESFKQTKRGRPGADTKYTRELSQRYSLVVETAADKIAEAVALDGTFPLISNVRDMSHLDILRAYKRQPLVEKRFSQFKNDFAVAPVFLKDVSRIQALLGIYFFALVVQTLLERQLRLAMEQQKIEALPLYPEGRDCKAPTTHRVIDVFEPIQRHELKQGAQRQVLVTELSKVHRSVLKLLRMKPESYGR